MERTPSQHHPFPGLPKSFWFVLTLFLKAGRIGAHLTSGVRCFKGWGQGSLPGSCQTKLLFITIGTVSSHLMRQSLNKDYLYYLLNEQVFCLERYLYLDQIENVAKWSFAVSVIQHASCVLSRKRQVQM